MRMPPDARLPYRLMATLPQPGPYRPETRHPRRSATISTIRSRRPISRRRSCASATTAGRRRSASAGSSDEDWIRHFGRFEPLPDNLAAAAGAALSRPSVPRVQSRHRRRPRLPVRAAARRRRPAARPRHQGLGPDALQPLRRRPADAEGRRARGARHRDARGARRRDLEDLLADRDRRGAGAQRRALPDPLGGAGPAQHSHIRIGTFQRLATLGEADEYAQARPTIACAIITARTAATTRRRGCSTMSPTAAARLAASYIAAGFVHGVLNGQYRDHRARASTTARGA